MCCDQPKRIVGFAGVVLVWAGLLGGCQYEQLQLENEQLWSQNQELQSELAQCRLALDGSEADRNALIARLNEAQSQVGVIAAANTTSDFGHIQGVEAVQSGNQITVRIPGDVLFAPGKVSLRSSAQKTLKQIAQVIQREYPSNTIHIKGYTDTDPIKKSKWADNLELSLQRAATVHRYLQKQGIDPARMEAVGQGQWHPRGTKAKSRRVEIVVSLDR